MSEYELHSLINDLFRDGDHMVDFWLSGTFAVIVARFIAGHRLSRRVVSIMTLLYLMSVAYTLSRFVLVATRSFEYRARLVSMGFEEFYTPQSGFVGGSISLILLFVGGTAATVYFLLGRESTTNGSGSELKSGTG